MLNIRTVKTSLAITVLLILLNACVPQNIADVTSVIGGNTPLPELPSLSSFFSDGFITSSVQDSLPEATWLDMSDSSPVASQSFNIVPGYYQYQLESYCLKAGTHGPTTGSGYLVAPVLGSQATMIQTILQNAAANPDIPQQDIQVILWTIRAGGSLQDMSTIRQTYAARLANPAQIVSYETLVSSEQGIINQVATSLMPQSVRDAMGFYNDFRTILNDVNATYEDIEALAVLTGFVEPGPGSRDVQSGTWHSIEENTFMRVMPQSYKKSVVEIVKLAPFALEHDAAGRIISFQSGPYRVETSYYDESSYFAGPDGTNYPSWEIKTARFIGPEASNDITIQDAGWVLPSDIEILSDSGDQNLMTRADYEQPRAQVSHFRWNEARQRLERLNDLKGDAEFYRDRARGLTDPLSEEDIKNFLDLGNYVDGLEAAATGGGLGWLIEHHERQNRALQYITCIFQGMCAPPGMDEPIDAFRDEPTQIDPTRVLGAPGNTSRQRIGLSPRFY